MDTFSRRHGFVPPDADITVRDDAPEELRGVLVDLAYESGMTPGEARSVVCTTLRRREDSDNWSPFPNIDREVRGYLDDCEWPEVYDCAEALYRRLLKQHAQLAAKHLPAAIHFEEELNKYMRRRGIGWQMHAGRLEVRGSEAFERSLSNVHEELDASGRTTAANEIDEAVSDLSRRPQPDITGAIQHALAALECVARDVTADPKSTFGQLLGRNPGLLPAPLDQALEKLWGFASEQGRHVREGLTLTFEEAEVAVHVAAAAARYLSKKLPRVA